MKKSANVAVALIGMMLAMPVLAQEMDAEATEAVAEEAVTDEAVADEAAAAEGDVAAEAAPADDAAAEGATEESSADASAETAEGEAAPADDGEVAEAAESTDSTDSAESADAGETAADEGGEVADEAAADETLAADSYSDDSGSGESSDEGGSEDGDSSEPFHLYAGVDKAEVRISFSDEALATAFGSDKINSSFYRLRVGTRLFEAIGVELQYGLSDQDDGGDNNFETGEYYGAFVVPTGVFLDVLEVSAPIGYSFIKAERGSASEKFDAVSFGLNIELPIIFDSEWIPELRIGGGGTVYQAKNDARIYGYHFGLRFDFKL